MKRDTLRPSRLLVVTSITVALFVVGPGAPRSAHAQWKDPKLIAGQVGFHVAVSFFGKLILGHERPGRALRKALVEGGTAGALAHAGYAIAGAHPHWALAGKTLSQKAGLTTRRSLYGEPVFDATLATHWELSHSFVHFELKGSPRVSLDVVNAAFSTYYLLSKELDLDGPLSLRTGSLTFRHRDAPERRRGFYLPGVIWFDDSRNENDGTLKHEIVHSLQAERGAAIDDVRLGPGGLFRVNWLVFATGVPAVLTGWPAHDDRLHEWEADAYAGRH